MTRTIWRLVLCGAVVLGLTLPARALTAEKVSSNSIWSWWSSPLAVDQGLDLYWGGITSSGLDRIYKRSLGATSYFQIGQREVDDHNAPAISFAVGEPTLTFYTEHPGTMHHRVAPAGSINFGNWRTTPFGFTSTYAQVLRRGPQVVVLTRGSSEAPHPGWYFLASPDNGVTWSERRVLFNSSDIGQAYLLLRPTAADPHTYHLAAYDHPTDASDIGYGTVTFDELYNGEPVEFHLSDLEVVWAPSPTGNPGQAARLLDVGDKRGLTIVYYARWNDVTTTPQYYQAIRQPDGSFDSVKIISSGGAFWEPSKYVAGIALDRGQRDRIYLGLKESGLWAMTTWDIDEAGVARRGLTLNTDSLPLVRPLSTPSAVIYQRLLRYEHYTDYSAEVYRVVGIP